MLEQFTSPAPVSPFADTALGPVGARETHPSAGWKELVTWGETQTLNLVLSFLEGVRRGCVAFSVQCRHMEKGRFPLPFVNAEERRKGPSGKKNPVF